MARTSRSTTQSQHKRFVEIARELECDEDKERFEAKLRKIATQKPNSAPAARTRKDAPNGE